MTIKFRNITEKEIQELVDKVMARCLNKDHLPASRCVEQWVRSSIYNMQELDNIMLGNYVMVSYLSKLRAVSVPNPDSHKPQINYSLEDYNTLTESQIIQMMTHMVKYYFVEEDVNFDKFMLFSYLYEILYQNIQDIVLIEDVIDNKYDILGGMDNRVIFKKVNEPQEAPEVENSIWKQIEEVIMAKEKENG